MDICFILKGSSGEGKGSFSGSNTSIGRAKDFMEKDSLYSNETETVVLDSSEPSLQSAAVLEVIEPLKKTSKV
jgi:hypothetical protein